MHGLKYPLTLTLSPKGERGLYLLIHKVPLYLIPMSNEHPSG